MAGEESPFPLLGEPLAVDLVNTVIAGPHGLVDVLDSPQRWALWLRAEAGRLPPPPAGDSGTLALRPPLDAALALREALRALFAAALRAAVPPADAVVAVNAASAAAPRSLELEWPADGPPRRRERLGGAQPGVAVLAEIARSAIDVLGGEDRARLRRCEGPGCVLLFLATNARRRWCAPDLCGNRVRVARHYRRRRA